MPYIITAHAQERIAERRIRTAWIARALCAKPTYLPERNEVQYFDPQTGTCIVVAADGGLASERGAVKTVYQAGE